MNRTLAALAFAAACFAAPALADCTVKNDTKFDFVVTYGNVSNHSFGSNHIEQFPKGSVSGKSKDGKSFSLSCGGSESWNVAEKGGAVVAEKK